MNKTSECRLSFSLRIKRAYTEGLFPPQKVVFISLRYWLELFGHESICTLLDSSAPKLMYSKSGDDWDHHKRRRAMAERDRKIVFGRSGISPVTDELALFLCRKSRWTGSDPVGCIAARTWNFLSLGLIGPDPTTLSLSWDCLLYHGGPWTYTAVDSEGPGRSAK